LNADLKIDVQDYDSQSPRPTFSHIKNTLKNALEKKEFIQKNYQKGSESPGKNEISNSEQLTASVKMNKYKNCISEYNKFKESLKSDK